MDSCKKEGIKEDARDKARELWKNLKAVIVVHKKDGTIEKEMGPFARGS